MEKHVNIFLPWEAFCSNLWSQSKAGSAQEQPAQIVVMVIRGKVHTCKLRNPNLQKKVANKFLGGRRDDDRGHEGARSPWSQESCPAPDGCVGL